MWFSKYGKYLFLTNLSIATTSLMFQVTVLYPWHGQISKELNNLSNKLKKD